MDLACPCCYQENREELERENTNSASFRVTRSSSLPGERGKVERYAVALRMACQTMQQPWLRAGQPGPKSDGQREKRVQMLHPIHQNNDKSRLPCEDTFPLH